MNDRTVETVRGTRGHIIMKCGDRKRNGKYVKRKESEIGKGDKKIEKEERREVKERKYILVGIILWHI